MSGIVVGLVAQGLSPGDASCCGAFLHGLAGEARTLRPGEVSLTPSDRLHALTVGASPVLLLYCWLGETATRQWWWRQDSEGHWHRDAYERTARASWERTASEAVPEDILARQ